MGSLATSLALACERTGAERRAQIKARKRALHRVVVEQAAALGYSTPSTQAFVVRRVWRSADPGIREVAWTLLRMSRPRKSRGRPHADEPNFKIAFLMHREIVRMRSTGEREYDIKARAADIVRDDLTKANPGKKIAERKRLLEYLIGSKSRGFSKFGRLLRGSYERRCPSLLLSVHRMEGPAD